MPYLPPDKFSSCGGPLFKDSKALRVQSSSILDLRDSGGQMWDRVGNKQTVMVCLLTYISTHRTTVEFLLL